MVSLIKSQIAKKLAPYIRGMGPDDFSLSLLRGKGTVKRLGMQREIGLSYFVRYFKNNNPRRAAGGCADGGASPAPLAQIAPSGVYYHYRQNSLDPPEDCARARGVLCGVYARFNDLKPPII